MRHTSYIGFPFASESYYGNKYVMVCTENFTNPTSVLVFPDIINDIAVDTPDFLVHTLLAWINFSPRMDK